VRTDADDATFKTVANAGLIGQGKAPNFRLFRLHINLRGTVSKEGQITVEKEDVQLKSNG